MRVVFRADASIAVGTGHLVRCLALASELHRRGSSCTFLVRGDGLGSLAQRITQEGHELITLSQPRRLTPTVDDGPLLAHAHWLPGGWRADADACLAVLKGKPTADWLVVDHYALDARWERITQQVARQTLAIDDLADREHDCDLLLDQNYVAGMESRYQGLVPVRCERLLGPRYALLKPAFAARRASLKSRDGIVRRVMVCFGGFDTRGYAMAAIEALRPYAPGLERIDVILGYDSSHKDRIAALSSYFRNLAVHEPGLDMVELYSDADLAIGAGGTMNWERACLGVPTLAFGIAANQRPVLGSLIEDGFVVGCADAGELDAHTIAPWLSCVLNSPHLLRGLALRSTMLVDGHGSQRAAKILLTDSLEIRRATLKDTDDIFRWRNHPEVRAFSFDDRQIARSTHETWMEKTLTDPQRVLLIAERYGQPVGIVRFDLSPPQATLSVYRVPSAKSGGGLVRGATKWLRLHHPEIRKITAEVLSANAASLAAFRNSGYHDAKNVLVIELDTP